MGVTSAGRGHGSTFFFELPVYGPDYPDLAPDHHRSIKPERTIPPRFHHPSSVACGNDVVAVEEVNYVGVTVPVMNTTMRGINTAWQEEGDTSYHTNQSVVFHT